jgi:hypothetical protein
MREKARTLADIEEKNITPDEETEAERTRRKANISKAMSLFKAGLSRQVEDEVQTLKVLKQKKFGCFESKIPGIVLSLELK